MAIENSITFGGVNSADFGIYISGEGVFNAPKRDVDMVTIPGRNGQLALDKGRFENIEVTYPAFNFEPNDYDTFAQRLSDFRNAICAQRGYQRLEDTFHPDEYRMATYIGGLDIKPIKYNTASEFDIIFNCKPQRWLKDGETAVTIGEWGETETASGDIVTVENENGVLAVKSLEVDLEPIQDLNGYDKPWVGGAGKNKLPSISVPSSVNGVTITKDSKGVININGTTTAATYFDVGNFSLTAPTAGTYIFSGSVGGSGTTWRLNLYRGNTLIAQSANGDAPAQVTLTASDTTVRATIYINSGVTLNNVKFYPMLRLASVSDATYEPYENICPISGHTSVDTYRTGKNLLPNNWVTRTNNGVTFTVNSDGSITANGTATADAITWLSIPSTIHGNCYFNGAYGGSASTYNIYVIDNTTGTRAKKWDGTTASDNGYTNLEQMQIVEGHTVTVYCRVMRGQTVSNVKFYPMICSATETDSTYEPYQGDTYTTALGRTVYGGTLDVVSGVLTVTHGYKAFGGGDTTPWYFTNRSDKQIVYTQPSVLSGVKTSAGYQQTALFDRFATALNSSQIFIGYAYVDTGWLNMVFEPNTFADANAFRTWLSSNNVQVVYELAEPQTYQLTAQQIELLTGTNNIWSDSGDVTVEYGQDPSVLFNPTLFESSPLLRIWGYGTVGFNGYEIELENDVLGNIVLLDAQTRAVAGTSTKLPKNLMNAGDPFTLDASSFFWAFSFDRTRIANVNILSVSDSDSSRFRSEKAGDGYYTNVSPLDFVYGTESTISNISTIQATYTDRDDHTGTFTARLVTQIRYYAESGQLAYTRNISGLPGSWLSMDYKSNLSTRGQVVGDSTVSVLGSPTIIDCDLGEAYKYAGSPISLNRCVDLGSDLPTLAPGKNEITYDDTVTELKITPRWWRI